MSTHMTLEYRTTREGRLDAAVGLGQIAKELGKAGSKYNAVDLADETENDFNFLLSEAEAVFRRFMDRDLLDRRVQKLCGQGLWPADLLSTHFRAPSTAFFFRLLPVPLREPVEMACRNAACNTRAKRWYDVPQHIL